MASARNTQGQKKKNHKQCFCDDCKGEFRDHRTVERHRRKDEEVNGAMPQRIYLGKRDAKKRKRNTSTTEVGDTDTSQDLPVGEPMNVDPDVFEGGSKDEGGRQDGNVEILGVGEIPPLGEELDPNPKARMPNAVEVEGGVEEGVEHGTMVTAQERGRQTLWGDEYGYEDGPPDSRSPSPAQGEEPGTPFEGGEDPTGFGEFDPTGLGDFDPTAEEDMGPESQASLIDSIRFSDEYIALIREATLDNDKLTDKTLAALRNPAKAPYPTLTKQERVSLTLYLNCDGASQHVYNSVKHTVETEHPESYPDGLLSHYKVESLMENLTGIVSVEDDMCTTGCFAYTGPLEGHQTCPDCGVDRAPSLVNVASLGAMGQLIQSQLGMGMILQWGRMMLPNRQYARSVFAESRYRRLSRRVSRMVKIEYDEPVENANPPRMEKITRWGEVQFYFLTSNEKPKAMVALFGERIESLHTESLSTIWACTFPDVTEANDLRLCDVKEIVAVASMQPFVLRDDDDIALKELGPKLWFVAEKSGLEDTSVFLSIGDLNRHLQDPGSG